MYLLLDTGRFQKLEQLGPWRIARPAAQAVWRPRLSDQEWAKADAIFTRTSGGDGRWEIRTRKLPEQWTLSAPAFGQMLIKLTDFGHLGIFPEQHSNWSQLASIISEAKKNFPEKPFNVLNLFAYTGGSTLSCAGAGAHVAHLDASKTSVAWARENAEISQLDASPIRWLVDDVQKFVAREIRRGAKYHGIILDPPSYGRGPKGETWKIEEMLPPLLDSLKELLAEDYRFVMLSSHSTGYTPLALTNLLGEICLAHEGDFLAQEMTVTEVNETDVNEPKIPAISSIPRSRVLPSGASCLYLRRTITP